MKFKKSLALLLTGAVLCGTAAFAGDPGSAADPLITLSWLNDTFIPDAVAQANSRADAEMDALEQNALTSNGDFRVKRGDTLLLDSGSTLTTLAGALSLAADAVTVDVTSGLEASGTLTANHRYLTTGTDQTAFHVTSDTAVVQITGRYQIEPSAEIDYNALADTLNDLGLFKGTDTPYGGGYDLELAPTRIQGLVLFLRLLGEEEAALNYPGNPAYFTDVPDWALSYASYAYDMGYTKGQGITDQWQVVFGTNAPIGAGDYVTFLLRALGYQEGTDFRWETTLADAQTLGLLTAGETEMLSQKDFLRAQTVYLSYYALSAPIAGREGETLSDRLISAGVFEEATYVDTEESLHSQRI